MNRALALVFRYLGLLALLACTRQEAAAPKAQPAPAQTLPRSDPPATAPGEPLVAFLGDSITAGYALSLEQAYPARLRERLAAEGTPFRLINAGVSGDTSAGGLRRVDWLLTQKPAVVVIELGANDGLRGAQPSEIAQNLRGIVAKVRAQGAVAVLLGMRLPPSYGEPYAGQFAALYGQLAQELALAYVPFFMAGVAGVPALNMEDGLHPTEVGHQTLAANVAAPLAAVLRTLR